MKMREELELYKARTSELEKTVERLTTDHCATLADWQTTQEQELAALETKHFNELGTAEAAYKKELNSKDSTITYRNNSVNELTEQVNNLQDILDVIPGVMPRKKEDQYGSSGGENKCHVRLASVLAQKFM